MDAEPGPVVLSRFPDQPRPARTASALLVGLAALAGCGSGEPPLPPDLPAIGGQVSLIRVPKAGGAVEAYLGDSLAEPIWTSRSPVPPIRQVLGVRIEARLLLAIDSAQNLIAVDLESRGVRQQASDVRAGVFVPNGAVYTVATTGQVTRFDLAAPTAYRDNVSRRSRFQVGSLGERFIVVTDSAPTLLVYSADGLLHRASVPEGPIAATYWGEELAVATGPTITLLDTEAPFGTRTLHVDARVRHLAFSPSGHRVYAALDGGTVAVLDRFSGAPLTTIALPADPSSIRTDATGRWMLARSASGDSAWVLDLATNRLTAAVQTTWDHDLPTVGGAATLLIRIDGDLAALDLSRPGLPEVGRVAGGADDWWIVSGWLPRERAQVAAVVAESVLVRQDSLLRIDTAAAPTPPTDQLYLQVSSSQNPDWSRELVRQLDAAGYPARVLEPGSVDDGFRVVVGPYATRDEAEEIGRRLGRPYFILTNPRLPD